MARFRGRYADYVSGLELVELGSVRKCLELTERRMDDLWERSGAIHVDSSVMHWENPPHIDANIMRVTFNPWYWTGREG